MTPRRLPEPRVHLAQSIADDLNQLRLGHDHVSDVNIKVGALSLVISSILAHFASDRENLAKAQDLVIQQLQIDTRGAWERRSLISINSEEETRQMLAKIGILKTR